MRFPSFWMMAGLIVIGLAQPAQAVETLLFDSSQVATVFAQGDTSETYSTEGYLVTHSLDKYWYSTIGISPGGTPTGRFQSVFWPAGLHAQAITSGPSGLLTSNAPGAQITIKRIDNEVFDLTHFSIKLLANTAGAGASIEIMPKLGGEDAFNDPLALDASGYGGMTFNYNTPSLVGFESYDLKLYVDYALTSATLIDASVETPEPSSLVLLVGALVAIPMRRRR